MEIPARSVVTVVMNLGDASGIHTVEKPVINDNKVYTLTGQQTKTPRKGIYIKNGKKYVVK